MFSMDNSITNIVRGLEAQDAKILCDRLFCQLLLQETIDQDYLVAIIDHFSYFALDWALSRNNPILLTAILRRTMTLQIDLNATWFVKDIIQDYIFQGAVENIIPLLVYGYVPDFTYHYLHLRKYGIPSDFVEVLSELHPSARHRQLLCLQVLMLFASRSQGISKELLAIWDAIPDAFLTYSEMVEVNNNLGFYSADFVQQAWYTYKACLSGRLDTVPEPRCLSHLCKIAVRSTLKTACNLPLGVEKLHLPRAVKEYLATV